MKDNIREHVGREDNGPLWETHRKAPVQVTRGQKKQALNTNVAIHIDWLSVTFPDDLLGVVELTSAILGIEPKDWFLKPYGRLGYQAAMLGPGNAEILYNAPDRSDIHVVFPGKVCGSLKDGLFQIFMKRALEMGAKATRLDVAMDDFEKIASPGDVREACISGQVVTSTRKWRKWEGGQVGQASLEGDTFYLGAPNSRQMLRVYDKEKESNGETCSIRWELQTRAEAAETFMEQIAPASSAWVDIAIGRLVGFCDFRDRLPGEPNPMRKPRLEWFRRLVANLMGINAYKPKPLQTLEGAKAYMEKYVFPMLAAVLTGLGGDYDWLKGGLHEGTLKWKYRHRFVAGAFA